LSTIINVNQRAEGLARRSVWIILHVAHQDLRAGADVVAGVPAQTLDVVEAAPDALVYLQDADVARNGPLAPRTGRT